jgi:hypothetical protein
VKYIKKPVVIDAIQWDGDNFNEIVHNFVGILCGQIHDNKLGILTLEGDMTADIGDWIIRGVKGEFYLCKPDIFEMTYEPVDEMTQLWINPEAASLVFVKVE